MQLAGKVALVTGGAVRLGKALVLALVEQGVKVALHYGSSAQAAEATMDQIKALGGEALALQADLRQTFQMTNLVDKAAAHFGGVDILVNNAAIFEHGDWADTTEENWDSHFAINLKAPFFLCQAFARQLSGEQRGHIINLADWRATRPNGHYLAYTLTKSALLTLTQCLAVALAPVVQVNAIAPGAILPPPGKDTTYLEKLAQSIPMRRTGSPEEVARAMLYLLQSDFVTGEVIYVTGGEHL